MFCMNCGHEIPEDSDFCPNCGKRVEQEDDRERTIVVGDEEDSPSGLCTVPAANRCLQHELRDTGRLRSFQKSRDFQSSQNP